METTSSALVALSRDLADAVERAAHAVVAVDARRRVGSSGFFVRPGLLVTADHAIEDEDDIDLTFADGSTERAMLAGRDATTDIALVRSHRDDIAPLARANAAELRIGALAVAVARDDDGDAAATMGVVGAIGAAWRTWRGGEIDRWIRPDLNLYPRFSGAPLVDVEGRLIGMNTWGLSRRQALTVPSVTLDRVIDALASGRRLSRGYLGVALAEVHLSPRVARDAGLDDPHAVVAVDVQSGGPADAAGMIVGDVVIALDGRRVGDSDELSAALGTSSVGTTVVLRILRGGSSHELRVTIAERPDGD